MKSCSTTGETIEAGREQEHEPVIVNHNDPRSTKRFGERSVCRVAEDLVRRSALLRWTPGLQLSAPPSQLLKAIHALIAGERSWTNVSETLASSLDFCVTMRPLLRILRTALTTAAQTIAKLSDTG